MGSIRVAGLNSFTQVNVLELIGDHTVTNTLALEQITIEVDVDLTLRPNEDAGAANGIDSTPHTEHVVLRTAIDQPSVELALMVAIEESLFDVALVDLLNHTVGCL